MAQVGFLWRQDIARQTARLAGILHRRGGIGVDVTLGFQEPANVFDGCQHEVLIHHAADLAAFGRLVIKPALEVGQRGGSEALHAGNGLLLQERKEGTEIIAVVAHRARRH